MSKRDTILILSSNFGQGHMATARALKSAAASHPELNFQIDVIDFSEEVSQVFNTASKKIYELNAKHAPIVHRWIYNSTDRSRIPLKVINSLNYPIRRRALLSLIKEHHPALIISNYPIWQHIAYQLTKESFPDVEFATLITDSISVHSAWAEPDSDFYLVANEPTAASIHKLGVSNNKIFPLGYPTHATFAQPVDTASLQALGLKPTEKYILLSGSSLRTPYVRRLIQLVSTHFPYQRLVVVTGRDTRLHQLLENSTQPLPEQVLLLGWTDKMQELIKGSQLVITKAGGSTVMECIAARKPMIINKIIPGQEEGNAELVSRYHLGEIAQTPIDVCHAIDTILNHEASYLEALGRHSRPNAAYDILAFLRKRLEDKQADR